MFTYVETFLPMFTHVYSCLPTFSTVYSYMFTYVYPCLLPVYLCLQFFTYGNPFTRVYVGNSFCLSLLVSSC